jgi:predicted DNA-binding transcriptional regulator YafY
MEHKMMYPQLPGMGRLEETKRIARILEIVQMIVARPKRNLRRDLADRFEVGERMIQKDLDIIRNGLKLTLIHTPSGYCFEDLPQLPALHYTMSEALSLLLAVQAASQIAGIGSAELAAAVARLKSLFPAAFLPLMDQVVVRPTVAARGEHRQQMLFLLHHALALRQKVRMVYETRSRGGEANERIVCPYHIMPYVRSWHLIGYCHSREAIRTFKLDRIREAELMREPYRIPDDFDPSSYMADTWGMMRADGIDPVRVVLHFEPEAGHWVAEEHWHVSQEIGELPDGSILFRLCVVPTPEFVNWLMYYGSRVRVLEPESLRDKLVEEHRKALRVQESS